jgi:hypothetical protein
VVTAVQKGIRFDFPHLQREMREPREFVPPTGSQPDFSMMMAVTRRWGDLGSRFLRLSLFAVFLGNKISPRRYRGSIST